MGLLGRWRIFTKREEGSSSIGVGTSTSKRASANWRMNWAGLGRSSILHWGWVVGADPAEVSAIAKLEVRRSFRRATVSWPVISVNKGERIFSRRPETAGAEASLRN
jgi:hypothetical protein